MNLSINELYVRGVAGVGICKNCGCDTEIAHVSANSLRALTDIAVELESEL